MKQLPSLDVSYLFGLFLFYHSMLTGRLKNDIHNSMQAQAWASLINLKTMFKEESSQ